MTLDAQAVMELQEVGPTFAYSDAFELCNRCGRRTQRALRELERRKRIRRTNRKGFLYGTWEFIGPVNHDEENGHGRASV